MYEKNTDMRIKKQDATIQLRLSIEEKELIERKAKEFKFTSISEYLRFVGKYCQEINVNLLINEKTNK